MRCGEEVKGGRWKGARSVGVPLPWGTYKEDQKFAVLKDGKAIPAQVLPLVVDDHG